METHFLIRIKTINDDQLYGSNITFGIEFLEHTIKKLNEKKQPLINAFYVVLTSNSIYLKSLWDTSIDITISFLINTIILMTKQLIYLNILEHQKQNLVAKQNCFEYNSQLHSMYGRR